MEFNIGTDIVNITRLQKTIDTMPSFIAKIYTKEEIKIAKQIKNPLNFYATRFAAKEAIIKATNSKFDFNEIEILKGDLGEPIAKIIGNSEYEIKISLSYDTDYAVAFCLVTKK